MLPALVLHHRQGEIADLQKKDFSVIDLGCQFSDFRDTAAAISNLDLVISVDSIIAHLAGALGKPTWFLLPRNNDWRWLQN